MPTASRRDELLVAALDAFEADGYQGCSLDRLARSVGMTKPAFTYHFGSKHDLAAELARPLLNDLEALAADPPPDLTALLSAYLDVLLQHRAVAAWMDGDKYLLGHDELGQRLIATSEALHELVIGSNPSAADRVLSSAVLGMLWRPLRNGYLDTDPDARQRLVDLTVATARTVIDPPPVAVS